MCNKDVPVTVEAIIYVWYDTVLDYMKTVGKHPYSS